MFLFFTSWHRIGGKLGSQIPKLGCLGCLGLLLVIGCTSSQPPSLTPPPSSAPLSPINRRISIGTTAKLRTLDPADAYGAFSGNLLYNLGDRLYTYTSGSTELKPQLATALPQVSEDGLVYTISLRQGVVFHDGTPFNAKAMAFSLKRFQESGGQPSFLLADTVESIEATGDFELTIQLKKPFAAFPALLAFSGLTPVSPKVYQQPREQTQAGKPKFRPKSFVGTGPYQLKRNESGTLSLDAFEQYWGAKPANPGIDIQLYDLPAKLFNAFRIGTIDVAGASLNPDQIDTLVRIAQNGDWQAITGPGSNITYLTLNLRKPPLDQVTVRQALALVINRPLLQQRVFNGQVDPLYTLIPTIFQAKSKPVFQTPDPPPSLVQAAQDLLAQAGYSASNPLTLTLWYRSDIPSDEPAAATLKGVIQEGLGASAKIELNQVNSTAAYTKLDQGVYPILLLDHSGDFYDPDNFIQPFLDCTTPDESQSICQEGATVGQGSFYFNPRMNELIDQQRREQDPQHRQQIFAEIQELLAQDVPYIPLWQQKTYVFAQKTIKGVLLEQTAPYLSFWTLRKE